MKLIFYVVVASLLAPTAFSKSSWHADDLDSGPPPLRAEAEEPAPPKRPIVQTKGGEFVYDKTATDQSKDEYMLYTSTHPYQKGTVEGYPAIRIFFARVSSQEEFLEKVPSDTLARDLVQLGKAKTLEEAKAMCDQLPPKGQWSLPPQGLWNNLLEERSLREAFLMRMVPDEGAPRKSHGLSAYADAAEYDRFKDVPMRNWDYNQYAVWSSGGLLSMANQAPEFKPTSLAELMEQMATENPTKTREELFASYVRQAQSRFDEYPGHIRETERILAGERKKWGNSHNIKFYQGQTRMLEESRQVAKAKLEAWKTPSNENRSEVERVFAYYQQKREKALQFYKDGVPAVCSKVTEVK